MDDMPVGSMGKRYWNDGKFSLGMEYGGISVLMSCFGIRKEDLK